MTSIRFDHHARIRRNSRAPRYTQRLLAFVLAAICAIGLLTTGIPNAAHAASGKLNEPAPQTIKRTVLTSGHSDAVSSFVDDGKFVLGSKADLDGVAGQRIDTDRTVFHLGTKSKIATPKNVPFLQSFGPEAWVAPEVQQQDLLWPGFSTENEALVAASDNGKVSLQLTDVQGPGRVEIFNSGGFGSYNRLFSSSDKLPAWTMGMRQHTHAFWAFSKPGRYELTFRGSTVIGGKTVTDEQRYSFHVGAFDALTERTTMNFSASTGTIDAGKPLGLTAQMTPRGARGAVEFVDLTTGAILGHAPVNNGVATLETRGLAPGQHRIIARFVPTYNDEFASVAIAERNALPITVNGKVAERPDHDDAKAPTASELNATAAGKTVRAPKSPVRAGSAMVAEVTDASLAGTWVSAWWHTDAGASWAGWQQVSFDGHVTVTAPGKSGDAKLSIRRQDGKVVGWDRVRVSAAPGESVVRPGGGSGRHGGSGGAGGSGSKPSAPPKADATATCEPSHVFDAGHIDAFNVSASSRGAVLQLKEDVTGSHVLHEAEDVLLRVKPEAEIDVPGGYPGAPRGFVLPVTQDPQLIWPGWDTNATTTSGYTDVRINVNSVDGPGAVHLYTVANFGSVSPLLDGGSTQLPGTIHVPKPAHVHAQWVFSKPGIYKLNVSATATNPSTGKSVDTAAHTYVFQVGDVPLGDAFCGVSVSAEAAAASRDVRDDVTKAEAQAAEQAKAEADKKRKQTEQGVTYVGSGADADAPVEADARRDEMDPVLVGALIGGGATAFVGGIAGVAWWYVRRMGALAAAAEGGADVAGSR